MLHEKGLREKALEANYRNLYRFECGVLNIIAWNIIWCVTSYAPYLLAGVDGIPFPPDADYPAVGCVIHNAPSHY
jgi:hypothetical protein